MLDTPFYYFCCEARQLNRRYGLKVGLPPLVLLTDQERLSSLEHSLRRLPYASLIILRDYHHPSRYSLGKQVQRLCKHLGHTFVVSGDGDLAMRLRADGLHIPEHQYATLRHWRRKKTQWVITAAAHSPQALRSAAALGADAVLYSPVFPTQSHPGHPGLGVVRFTKVVKHSPCPVYALGGVNSKNIRSLKNSGAIGIAAIDAFA